MKLTFHLIVVFISGTLLGCSNPIIEHNPDDTSKNVELALPAVDLIKTHQKANEALLYCKQKKFTTDYCILIDMSLHSGVNRFFVWDFTKDTICHSFLVSHGCGNSPWSLDHSKENPVFSNTDGSHCSSLGKYKIGKRAYSDWGINVKYFLHGLDITNSNALGRLIVFHSWDQISDKEVFPNGTPEGWGCPSISNSNMKIVDALLKSKSQPVLMWIYN